MSVLLASAVLFRLPAATSISEETAWTIPIACSKPSATRPIAALRSCSAFSFRALPSASSRCRMFLERGSGLSVESPSQPNNGGCDGLEPG